METTTQTTAAAATLPPPAKRRRESCARCLRPPRVCYCTALPPQPLATRGAHVLILQHRHEKRHRNAISSVPVLTHVLDAASATVVTVDDTGAAPGANDELDRLLFAIATDAEPFKRVLVLFPDATAKTLTPELLTSLASSSPPLPRSPPPGSIDAADAETPAPQTLLVVIDGTWTEAKKIVYHSRAHLETLAAQRRARGLAFEFICLDDDSNGDSNGSAAGARGAEPSTDSASASSVPRTSIYGELRREPMEGCLSTLEAVALALKVLEPTDAISTALLGGFRAMVALQTQCMARGRQQALEKHGGVSKREAIAQRQQQEQQQQQMVASDASRATPSSTRSSTAPAPRSLVREYVFYTTHVDFRQRKQLVQQGESVTCTYDQAREQCQVLNASRKRGERLAFLSCDAFTRQTQQLSETQDGPSETTHLATGATGGGGGGL